MAEAWTREYSEVAAIYFVDKPQSHPTRTSLAKLFGLHEDDFDPTYNDHSGLGNIVMIPQDHLAVPKPDIYVARLRPEALKTILEFGTKNPEIVRVEHHADMRIATMDEVSCGTFIDTFDM
jgi:hypothetical protein